MKRVLGNLLEILDGICICFMCLMVIIAIFDRFIVGYGLAWPEEAARFLLIWSAFLSAASVTRKGQHYASDFLVARVIPSGCRIYFNIFLNIVCCLALLLIVVKGVELVDLMGEQVSPAMRIPMSWVYSSVPIGAALMVTFYVIQSVGYLRQKTRE